MEGPGQEIWLAVSDAFGQLRGRQIRDLWLGDARPHSFHRGLFTLDVANAGKKAAIDARYLGDLETLFRDITGSPVRLRTRVVEDDQEERPASPPPPPRPLPATGRAPDPLPSREPSAFAVTPANALAFRAVQRFVEQGDRSLQPIFVHGPPGSGKTALARWALHRLRELDPAVDPLVLSGESLARDVSRAARMRTFGELQRTWAGRDIIVLDEAHRLRGKRTAQAMATSLVAPALVRDGAVLVLSRHRPEEIHGLDERLRSHFLGGMVVSLGQPDADDRRVVLQLVADGLPLDVEPAVVQALAERFPGTLTDAVDALQREAARAAEEGRPVTVERLTARLAAPSQGEMTLEGLVGLLAEETGVAAERIRSAEKSRDVACVRHLCVYLAARSLGLSSRQICRSLRLRSPSIVAYARRAVERRRALDPAYDRLIHVCQARLTGAQRDFAW